MARNVEVLLRENVKDLGRCGDVVRVSPGYARNFLLPRQIAMQATDDNKRAMAKRRVVLDAVEAKRTAEFEALVGSLSGIQLQTSAKADDQGHLFGSVSASQIVEMLQKMGHTFEEKAVRLDAPIKTVGTHPVKLHVHGDMHAEILVIVAAEGA
jgi:large subunit ribosomal protein L9